MGKKKSKLMALKKWLTIPDTAKYLSNLMEEEVNGNDILRFALDGHLKLSVNFVNTVKAKRGKVVSKEEVGYDEENLDSSLDGPGRGALEPRVSGCLPSPRDDERG